MILDLHARYRLKRGAIPIGGHPIYGTKDLVIIEIDTDDMTAPVNRVGYIGSGFLAHIDDLVLERES